MTKVAVIGNAGGGKSTMARALAAAHDLPYIAIDKFSTVVICAGRRTLLPCKARTMCHEREAR